MVGDPSEIRGVVGRVFATCPSRAMVHKLEMCRHSDSVAKKQSRNIERQRSHRKSIITNMNLCAICKALTWILH